MPDPRTRAALLCSSILLCGYLATVLLLDHDVGRWHVTLAGVAVLSVACGALVATLLARVARRADPSRQLGTKLAAAQIALLVTLLGVDLSFAALRNAHADAPSLDDVRYADATTWIGEVYPPLYWHAEGFRLAKPNYRFSATHYGDGYVPALLASPTLRDQVLALKTITMSIDGHGFRATTAPRHARVFALGDSFTFGWGVGDGETWPALLAERLGEPVYNLGVHDSSPLEEVVRLRHLLRTQPEEFRPRHVVWLLFEGNDLEDCRPIVPARATATSTHAALFADTVVGLVLQIPGVVQHESVIDRVRRGELVLAAAPEGRDPHLVDGVRSPHPVHHSERLGWMLWLREQVERAHASESYVARHPHRGCVATAFGEMGSLAREYGFGVTVVVAPSAVRVYAPHVDDLDAPLADPHLIHALLAHARDAGFPTVDLLDAFAPHAAGDPRELLYFRDDDHWSPRGHAVVAGILADHLAGADARQPPSPDQQLRAAELRG